MKRCSTSRVIEEMQIKTTVGHYLTPVGWLLFKNKTKQKINIRFQEGREFGTIVHSWWDCKMVHPLWKTAWRFPNKLKTEGSMLQQSYSRLLILMNWTQNLDKAGTPTLTATVFTAVRCGRDVCIYRRKNRWRKRGVDVCTVRCCSVEKACHMQREERPWRPLLDEMLLSERRPVICRGKKDPEDRC